MSITTELAEMEQNLQNAKNTIATAGGTVGNTGLAGLANEISTIPAGEGEIVIPTKPEVTSGMRIAKYEYTLPISVQYYQCDVTGNSTSVNSSTLSAWAAANCSITSMGIDDYLRYDSSSSKWTHNGTAVSLTSLGISGGITPKADATNAYIRISAYPGMSMDGGLFYMNGSASEGWYSADLTAEFWNSLFGNSDTFTYANQAYPRSCVKYFVFGPNSFANLDFNNFTSTGFFLAKFSNLEGVYNFPWERVTNTGSYFMWRCKKYSLALELPNATTIGDNFCNSCGLDYLPLISLPNTTTIGTSFLSSYTTFGGRLSMPKVTTIGNTFMGYSSILSSAKIELPSTLTSIGENFLQENTTFSGTIVVNTDTIPANLTGYRCFTTPQTGVTLEGTRRATWLNNIPQSTSDPYRILIDGGK